MNRLIKDFVMFSSGNPLKLLWKKCIQTKILHALENRGVTGRLRKFLLMFLKTLEGSSAILQNP